MLISILAATALLPANTLAQSVVIQHSDVNNDGVVDTIVGVKHTEPGGARWFVRAYSGATDRELYSYHAPRQEGASLDLNGDGMITIDDVAIMLAAFNNQQIDAQAFDLNQDGDFDANDLGLLLPRIGEPLPATGPPCAGVDCGPNGIPCSDCTCRRDCFPGGGGGGGGGGPAGVGNLGGGGGGGGGSGGGGGGGGSACPVSIDPMPGMPTLHSVGVWTPNDTDDDTTNDTDDLPTIKATAAGQGTYTWEVMSQGPGAVTLLDATTGAAPTPTSKTIRIQGVTPSAALDDVTIRVTFTTADNSCMSADMIHLTVILATLTFRPANPNAQPPEVWSPHNDLNPALFPPGHGLPMLGKIIPNIAYGTTVFSKNIEIQAILQPCINGLNSIYDFKRNRQGYLGQIDWNNFSAHPNNCPPPLWCDDDAGPNNNSDEDLTLDPAPLCTLYVIDGPGLGVGSTGTETSGPPCASSLDNQRLINCFQFLEWLNADGFRASQNLPWYAGTEIWCHNGTWGVSSTICPNIMGQGTFVFTPPPGALQSGGESQQDQRNPQMLAMTSHSDQFDISATSKPQAKFNVSKVIKGIRSSDTRRRMLAENAVYKAVKANIITKQERSKLIKALLPMAQIKKNVYEFSSQPKIAIELLGILKSTRAMPILFERLLDDFPRFIVGSRDMFPLAVGALFDIGEPAVVPILERAGIENERHWVNLNVVLQVIDKKSPLVRQAMRTYLDAETGPGSPAAVTAEEKAQRLLLKTRLEKFLATPEPFRPKPKPAPTATNQPSSNLDSSK